MGQTVGTEIRSRQRARPGNAPIGKAAPRGENLSESARLQRSAADDLSNRIAGNGEKEDEDYDERVAVMDARGPRDQLFARRGECAARELDATNERMAELRAAKVPAE